MNGAGGGQPDNTLDAFLDGRLDGAARATFQARLASDPLAAAELDAQNRLDAALRGLFVATPFPGVPVVDALGTPAVADATGPATAPVSQIRGVLWGSLIGAALFCLSWRVWTQVISPTFEERPNLGPVPAEHAPATTDDEPLVADEADLGPPPDSQ